MTISMLSERRASRAEYYEKVEADTSGMQQDMITVDGTWVQRVLADFSLLREVERGDTFALDFTGKPRVSHAAAGPCYTVL